MKAVIDDGISQGKYIETVKNKHSKHFQNFLYRHFYRTEYYKKCVLFLIKQHISLQLLKHTNLIRLKILILADIALIYMSKGIANYHKPLAKNDFIISDTLTFPDMLKKAYNSEDYEYVSYECFSVKETFG